MAATDKDERAVDCIADTSIKSCETALALMKFQHLITEGIESGISDLAMDQIRANAIRRLASQ